VVIVLTRCYDSYAELMMMMMITITIIILTPVTVTAFCNNKQRMNASNEHH